MLVTAEARPLPRRTRRAISPVSLIGLALVALVVVWLVDQPRQDAEPSSSRSVLIGITNGCIYALVALGYSLVYGILELINFAHGDVFMLGGMFAITVATAFGLQAGAADLWPLVIVCLLALRWLCCAVINASIEFVAYRPLRARAPARAADHGDRDELHHRGRRR